MLREFSSLTRRFDVVNASLTTALPDSESAKARIATVSQNLTSSARVAVKALNSFEEKSKCELETVRKWVAALFALFADASDKVVEDSLRGLDEPTNVDDGPPASYIAPLIIHPDCGLPLFPFAYYLCLF